MRPFHLLIAVRPGCCSLVLLLACIITLPPANAQTPQAVHDKYRAQTADIRNDTASINHLLAYCYDLMDVEGDSSLRLLERTYEMSTGLDYPYGIARSHLLKGMILSDRGLYDSAKILFTRAIPYFEKLHNDIELGKVYNNMANLYNFQGLLQEAMDGYLKAASLLEKTSTRHLLAPVYCNIGTIFQKLDQPAKSLQYIDKAEAIARQNKDTVRVVIALIAKAVSYKTLGRRPAFLETTQAAMHLSDRKEYLVGRYLTRLNLSDDLCNFNQYDPALNYLRVAESLAIRSGDPYYLSGIYLGFAKAYKGLKQYARAKEYLLKSVAIATPIHQKQNLQRAYDYLTIVYTSLGMKAASLDAFQKYQLYSDSLRNEEVTNQVNTLETRFRTLQKDKAIGEQQLAIAQRDLALKQKDTWTLIWACITLVVLITGAVGWFYYRQQRLLQQQKLLTLQREYDLRVMQAMMEGEERERGRIARYLHDGVASAVSAARLKMDALGIQQGHLSALAPYRESLGLLKDATASIREAAHNLQPVILQDKGLRDAVQAYCDKIGRNHQLSVSFQSHGQPERFKYHFELLTFHTIQELLNNVIKHANASAVIVQLSFFRDMFSITVEDNGKGFDPASLQAGGSLGLRGLSQRMEPFGGTVHIDSSSEGSSIRIEFLLSEFVLAA
ncbi:tetratricopeptide repeat-containing sensor histidine kinase [Paraflavitalea sp. CAU 1676]|uniref:tetratricopeptide repeat-containing sensor histidine kinase n=1 Tax=Paraflavitalea sp. CAU 1676 TaxID=3032598 RepID=UPI0023DCBBBE|nr:tetratricopeptide repeat-containing sensor histidine kinase [Paraflavitalea sp. CAU 1676]MDF2188068.1 tetratricopeptide repeat protein [Paraflavitalea sp. CAU 1676]